MSDNDRDLDNAPEERPAPHRVIGTPPPARGLLTDPGPGEAEGRGGTEPDSPGEGELPSDPPDLKSARNWERVAAVLFVISALASVGFVAAYVSLEIGGASNGDVVLYFQARLRRTRPRKRNGSGVRWLRSFNRRLRAFNIRAFNRRLWFFEKG